MVNDISPTELPSGLSTKKNTMPHVIPLSTPPINTFPTTAATATVSVYDHPILAFSDNYFKNKLIVTIANTGYHPTRGLDVTTCENSSRVKLLAYNKDAPVGKKQQVVINPP